MANMQNLTSFDKMEPKRRKEIQAMGVKASADKRKKRKLLKEELLALLEKGDTQEKISLALIERALKGETKAFEVIRDTIGEKPKEVQEVKVVETDWFK